jgi:co-chaperonin GroES (HSP10)
MTPTVGVLIAILVVLTGGAIELFTYFHQHKHSTKPVVEPDPVKFGFGDRLKFWALGDRLIIREDEFESGYECTTCKGRGKVTCTNCGGTKVVHMEGGPDRKCSICDGTDGRLTCPSCQGKGGILVMPEVSERRPTTGTIVSIGPRVKSLRIGQAVMYSNFSGYVVDLSRGGSDVVLRILHDSEILCGMEGHLTLSNLKGKSEIATFQS